MRPPRRFASYVIAGWTTLCLVVLWSTSTQAREPSVSVTALDLYIAKPDPSYAWKIVDTKSGDGFTTYVVDLKSQTWRSENDVDRTVFKRLRWE